MPRPGVINRIVDGIYHISTQFLYRSPQWFLDRVALNKAHIILYKGGKPIAKVVPMDCEVGACEADYGLPEHPQNK